MAGADKRSAAIDAILARTIASGDAAPRPDCPDPNLLAAWFDRTLAGDPASRMETHLGDCPRCQGIVAVMARAESAAMDAAPRPAWRVLLQMRFLAPVVVGMFAIVTLATVFHDRFRIRPRNLQLAARAAPHPVAHQAMTPPLSAPSAQPEQLAKNEAISPLHHMEQAQRTAGAGAKGETPVARTAPRAAIPAMPVSPPSASHSPAAREAPVTPAIAAAPPGRESRLELSESSPPAPHLELKAAPPKVTSPAAARAAQAVAGAAAPSGPVGAPRFRPPTAMAYSSRYAAQAGGAGAAAAPHGSGGGFVTVESPDRSTKWTIGPGGSIGSVSLVQDSFVSYERQTSGVKVDLLGGSAVSDKICWIVGRAGTILRTTDGGKRWTKVESPTTADIAAVNASSADAASIRAADGAAYSTADAGKTWKAD
jgi:Photosynthesis system II assembly factor YCF48/Putative zinc-finger